VKLFFAVITILISSGIAAHQAISESIIKERIDAKGDSLIPLEGIWNVTGSSESYHYDTLYSVQKDADHYRVAILIIDGKPHVINLSPDSIRIDLMVTDIKYVYLYKIFFPETGTFSKTHAVICKDNTIEYTYETPEEILKLKKGKQFSTGMREVNIYKWNKSYPVKK
jgi:hypothetical protein